MANFAVAASPETIERANRVMELYAKDGEKKEDVLIKILGVAESESIRGTHPTLGGYLKAIDTTIATLVKQINGVVSGQDSELADLKERLDTAIEQKNAVLESVKAQIEEAKAKSEEAEKRIEEAQKASREAIKHAEAEAETVKKDAALLIEKANMERDQAIRERDDARTIATEKTASNDLLMRQMTAMEAAVAEKNVMEDELKKVTEELAKFKENLEKQKNSAVVAAAKAETEKEKAVAAAVAKTTEGFRQEMESQKADLQKRHEAEIERMRSDAENHALSLKTQITSQESKIAGLEAEIKRYHEVKFNDLKQAYEQVMGKKIPEEKAKA